MTVPVSAVLRTLARLSDAERPQRIRLDMTRTAGLAWLGDQRAGWEALRQNQRTPTWTPVPWTPSKGQRLTVARLASFDALHQEDRLLRLGWAFLCGPAEIDGQRRRLCMPLVSRPVRLHSAMGHRYGFQAAGDLMMFALLNDWSKVAKLEARLPRAGRPSDDWIRAALMASGFGELPIVGPEAHPQRLVNGPDLVVVAGAGLYAGEPAVSSARGSSLYDWSARAGIERTALAALYRTVEPVAPLSGEELVSVLPLSPSQQAAVRAAHNAPVTVIGGPPGSGKTHTLAALALDAVAAGRSVLLASRSRNAADVLGAAIRGAGGPAPVLFGDSELRQEMARELDEGLAVSSRRAELADRDQARQKASAAVSRIERAVGSALDEERLAESAWHGKALMPGHRAAAPRAFEPDADLARLRSWLDQAARPRRGMFAGWRRRRALRTARRLAGADRETDLVDLQEAVAAAEESAAQVRVAAAGGTTMTSQRKQLVEQDARSRAAAAAWLGTLVASRRRGGARWAIAVLAKALRSGRAARRRALTEVSGKDLVGVHPLWVGTLADVEDILPAVPGMFDLVVVDEASHVDQPLAAPALLRGRRAVIAGDPRQLRHVSFVGDEAMRESLAAEGSEPLADRLDVRRVSLFDAAVAVAGVHWLVEHHRCAPHLIGFAADRFYEGRIALLTTHPSIADIDCIDVEHVTGGRDGKGVNAVEVEAVLAHLRRRIAAGVRSIGVVSPFRAQADALEQALLDRLSLTEITRGGVRVGTVHGVQGSEFDEVVISFALAAEDGASAWRFVDDQNLFAVLTTRARRLVHVVTSVRQPPGLVGEYLRHADVPPTETAGVEPADEWTAQLSAELTALGLTVRTGYPLGQWRLDLVVGERESAVAVETRVHPEGTPTHLARWRALAGAGWRIHDAFPTRFDHDPIRAAVELGHELRSAEKF